MAGAGKALRVGEPDFAAMVKDAMRNGHWTVIAHASDDQSEPLITTARHLTEPSRGVTPRAHPRSHAAIHLLRRR